MKTFITYILLLSGIMFLFFSCNPENTPDQLTDKDTMSMDSSNSETEVRNDSFQTFCGQRAKICIDLPKDIFSSKEDSLTSCDVFAGKDSSLVNMCIRAGEVQFLQQGHTAAEIMEARKKSYLQQGAQIDSSYAEASGWILKGRLKNGNFFVHKWILKHKFPYYIVLQFTKDRQDFYDKAMGSILKSIR